MKKKFSRMRIEAKYYYRGILRQCSQIRKLIRTTELVRRIKDNEILDDHDYHRFRWSPDTIYDNVYLNTHYDTKQEPDISIGEYNKLGDIFQSQLSNDRSIATCRRYKELIENVFKYNCSFYFMKYRFSILESQYDYPNTFEIEYRNNHTIIWKNGVRQ